MNLTRKQDRVTTIGKANHKFLGSDALVWDSWREKWVKRSQVACSPSTVDRMRSAAKSGVDTKDIAKRHSMSVANTVCAIRGLGIYKKRRWAKECKIKPVPKEDQERNASSTV